MRGISAALIIMSVLSTIVVAWQPEIEPHDGDTGNVNVVAFSPNGTFLVTGDSLGAIEVWETDSFTLVRDLPAHTGYTRAVSFSAGGDLLFTSGDDGAVRVWNTTDWSNVDNITGHTDVVGEMSVCGSAGYLATGSRDDSLRIYNLSDLSLMHTFTNFDSDVTGLGWGAGCDTVYGTDLNSNIRQFNVTQLSYGGATAAGNGSLYTMAVSPDGSWMATGHSDTTLKIWSLPSKNLVHSTTIHAGWVNAVAFSPNSSALVSHSYGTNPGYVTWMGDPTTQIALPMNSTVCGAQGIAFSSTGYRVAIPLCKLVSVMVMDSDGDTITDPHDGCPDVWGNSTENVTGCPDNDGDGYDDDTDSFPGDPSEWADSDGDGIGDNSDNCPLEAGNSTNDSVGCVDTDGDGWSDAGDDFPNDPNEWKDTDGDGIGDRSDDCPTAHGDSYQDRTGCPDIDNDGWSDGRDDFPSDPTEWNDTDGDGVGDNSDACPTVPGPIDGCPDDNNGNGTNNGTNGTGNETNGTGNETDPGNGTGDNETGNETGNNGTGTNGTNNTGGNGTNGTGENGTDNHDNGTGPGPETLPNGTSDNGPNTNGSVNDDASASPAVPIAIASVFIAASLAIAGIATTRRRRNGIIYDSGVDQMFDGHPTLVVDDIPEFEAVEAHAEVYVAPQPVPDSSRHILETPYTFEEQLDYIKQRIQPMIDEGNRPLVGELKELKSRIGQVFHEKEMGERRRDRLYRDIDNVERGLNQLLPIKI
jgi:WD40 repeat protein